MTDNSGQMTVTLGRLQVDTKLLNHRERKASFTGGKLVTTESSLSPITSHRDLIVWQKSMDLVDLIYDLTDRFPNREYRALIPQISRSVVSVPANIAEGQARVTARDFANFLVISRSSLI